ncbi:hypothetical protein AB0Y38_18685 [Lysinibacillus capsici]|uniref:hypothetical protein n=1 Tax=Lysinibacillus capsici TaxID=2115968 RepID=UPI003F257D74
MYLIDTTDLDIPSLAYTKFIDDICELLICLDSLTQYDSTISITKDSISQLIKQSVFNRNFTKILTSGKLKILLLDLLTKGNIIKKNYNFQKTNYKEILKDYTLLNGYKTNVAEKNFFTYLYSNTLETKYFEQYIQTHNGLTIKDIGNRILLKSSVCPYCNGSYLDNKSYSKDHFLPKANFPLLSIFINNLVLSCGVCNERYKLENYYIPSLHPYIDNINDQFKFTFFEDIEFVIGIVITSPINSQIYKATENYLELFKIKERYNSRNILTNSQEFLGDLRESFLEKCNDKAVNSINDIKIIIQGMITQKIHKLKTRHSTQLFSKLHTDILLQISNNLDEEAESIYFSLFNKFPQNH